MTQKDQDKKRGTIYEVINLDQEFFFRILTKLRVHKIDYKYRTELYNARDAALIATLTLTGLRASEVILLKKVQFLNDGDLVRVHKVRTIKGGDLRNKIPLPTKGVLGEFTKLITSWLNQVQDGGYIFPRGSAFSLDFNAHISRVRVYQIVRELTGEYPHYFRAVNATIWARIFEGNAWMLKSFFGWKNLNSSSPYVKTYWEEKEGGINAVF